MDKKKQEKLLTEIMEADAKDGLYDHIGDTNKIITMKLYTKEMFLIAAEKCEVSIIDAKHIMKYIDEYVTPIELPSDEEIRKESHNYFMRGQLGFEAAADTERAFLRGVL